jgi:TPR repeat protein
MTDRSLDPHALKLSADQGFADAQFVYGTRLFLGIDVEKNESLGAYYLKLSADQGHPQLKTIMA